MNRLAGTGRGFTLVEVTLALGIVGFCLVALLGMFSFGLDGSRRTADDTTTAAAAAQLAGELWRVRTLDATGNTAGGQPYLDGTYYFDAQGREVFHQAGAPAASVAGLPRAAVYVCHLTGDYLANGRGPSAASLANVAPAAVAANNAAPTPLTRLTLAFRWPASVPPASRSGGSVYYVTTPTATPPS